VTSSAAPASRVQGPSRLRESSTLRTIASSHFARMSRTTVTTHTFRLHQFTETASGFTEIRLQASAKSRTGIRLHRHRNPTAHSPLSQVSLSDSLSHSPAPLSESVSVSHSLSRSSAAALGSPLLSAAPPGLHSESLPMLHPDSVCSM
jgi:hypothetical protein